MSFVGLSGIAGIQGQRYICFSELMRWWLFEDCDPALDSVLIARRFGLKQGQKVR